MPHSIEFQLRSIYQALSGVTPGPPGTKSTEYWLGLIYDALYGTSHSPHGGLKSKEWWLKQMRSKLLTDYGVDVTDRRAPEYLLKELLAAID